MSMTSRLTLPAFRSDRFRASCGIAIALFGLSNGFLVAPALAEPASGLTLHWQAPAGCPQQAEVRERIRALVGTTRAASSLQAEGTITQINSNHFHLKLVTRAGGLVGGRNLAPTSGENLPGD